MRGSVWRACPQRRWPWGRRQQAGSCLRPHLPPRCMIPVAGLHATACSPAPAGRCLRSKHIDLLMDKLSPCRSSEVTMSDPRVNARDAVAVAQDPVTSGPGLQSTCAVPCLRAAGACVGTGEPVALLGLGARTGCLRSAHYCLSWSTTEAAVVRQHNTRAPAAAATSVYIYYSVGPRQRLRVAAHDLESAALRSGGRMATSDPGRGRQQGPQPCASFTAGAPAHARELDCGSPHTCICTPVCLHSACTLII